MPFYYTFEMKQNKLSNEGIILKLLTDKAIHNKKQSTVCSNPNKRI